MSDEYGLLATTEGDAIFRGIAFDEGPVDVTLQATGEIEMCDRDGCWNPREVQEQNEAITLGLTIVLCVIGGALLALWREVKR